MGWGRPAPGSGAGSRPSLQQALGMQARTCVSIVTGAPLRAVAAAQVLAVSWRAGCRGARQSVPHGDGVAQLSTRSARG